MHLSAPLPLPQGDTAAERSSSCWLAAAAALAMDGPPPPRRNSTRARSLADLDADTLAHCASFLGVRDVSSLALTCKALRSASYSDAVWRRLFSTCWPHQPLASGTSGVREQYLARRTSLLQMKFADPLRLICSFYRASQRLILLNKDDIFFSEGLIVHKLTLNTTRTSIIYSEASTSHSGRVTCMRLFPVTDTSLCWRGMKNDDKVLATSSSDHTVRLLWKGRAYRCFRGHDGPVTTLADEFLGGYGCKVIASGGEDCTVRLWSVSPRRLNDPLKMTYHGHEKPVSLLSVARHKSSLLVSISTDSRVRVWDTTAPLSSCSSLCVGMASVLGPPVGMKCLDSLCYIASGASVVAIDLRTMQKAFTSAIHPPRIYSFDMLPSKGLICTGGEDKAMLWDIRMNQEKPYPVANLDAQTGRVTLLHMDPYKVVTGGPSDYHAHVYETNTGSLANSVDCRRPSKTEVVSGGLSAMAVDGCRILISECTNGPGDLYYIDFSNCSVPCL